ncbi:hypothetical protein CI610_02741 [invertebrate metagenome]|uniref:PHD-type domain-containing protein n=1 Tax=invertebrate metagenome TaxID=1711999 RepID=A0A2H9T533_9ZZZZ
MYLLDTAVTKGKCKKLCSPWKGPGVIVKKISPYLYQIKLRSSVLVTNHDRMAPCKDRKIPAWIQTFKTKGGGDAELPDQSTEVFCVCRKPWQGRFMIQCDYCQEWYHGSCVNVTATEALDIDKYKCKGCCNK